MFARFLCCALCALVVAPAQAVEITTDTLIDYAILDGDSVLDVRGDAVLTLGQTPEGTRPILLPKVRLWDNASLVFGNVDLRAGIWVFGDNQIDFNSGRFLDHEVSGNGNATINMNGNTSSNARFIFSGGEQTFNVRGVTGIPRIYGGHEVRVNVFAAKPTVLNTDGFLALGWLTPFGGNVFAHPTTDWHIYANDDRPAGDTNSDGVVDLVDLNNVRNHFGSLDQSGKTLPLDGTAVDLDDLNAVRNTFGQSTSSNPVPEPSAMALGFVALAGILARCRYSMSLRRSP